MLLSIGAQLLNSNLEKGTLVLYIKKLILCEYNETGN